MTRTTNSYDDWGPCVDVRGRFGAKVGADLEISLHGDGAASATHGFFIIRPGYRAGTRDIWPVAATSPTRSRRGLSTPGSRVSTTYGGTAFDVRRDLGTLNAATYRP